MNKSLAETVNFAEAVQKKAYEKKAQQVDTFVKSETAEQKLARSGKMQTAKAIESLAKLGGTVVDGMAKKREQEVALMQQDLQNITAQMIQEARAGKQPYESETFGNLPLRFQTQVKTAIGRDTAKRDGEAALSELNDFTAADPVARQALIDKYRKSKEIITAMDSYEALGYESAFAAYTDKINNKGAAVHAGIKQQEISDNYQSGLASIVSNNFNTYQDLIESDSYAEMTAGFTQEQKDAHIEMQLKNMVSKSVDDMESHFKGYGESIGIDVPPAVLKKLTVDSLVKAAVATGNPFFLDPTNYSEDVRNNYMDQTTAYTFAKARIDLKAQFDRDGRQAINDRLDADKVEVLDAQDAFENGELSWDKPDLSFVEKQVLTNAETVNSIGSDTSSTNRNMFIEAVQQAITEGKTSITFNGTELTQVDGSTAVALDKESLRAYLKSSPLFNMKDNEYIGDNLDAMLSGINAKGSYPDTINTSLLTPLAELLGDSRAKSLIADMTPYMVGEWNLRVAEWMGDNGWKPMPVPVLTRERTRFVNDMKAEALDRANGTRPPQQNMNNVTVDGLSKQTDNPNNPKQTPITTYEQLPPDFKDAWEQIKDKPEDIKKWQDRGFPVPPEVETQQKVEQASERKAVVGDIIERLGVDREKLADVVFDRLHAKHGDGMRFPASVADNYFFNGLDITDEEKKLLEDQVTHEVASDFINSGAKKAASSMWEQDWEKWQRYAADVMQNPYNVYKYDDWLEGDETIYMANENLTAFNPEEILNKARKIPWFDPSIMMNDKEYK